MTKMEYAARESAAAIARAEQEQELAYQRANIARRCAKVYRKLSDNVVATVETGHKEREGEACLCLADQRSPRYVALNESECRELLAYLTDMLSPSDDAVPDATTNV